MTFSRMQFSEINALERMIEFLTVAPLEMTASLQTTDVSTLPSIIAPLVTNELVTLECSKYFAGGVS